MCWLYVAFVVALGLPSAAQDTSPAVLPRVSVSVRSQPARDVLVSLAQQSGVPVAAHPFSGERRISVELSDVPFPEALDTVAAAAVSTWDWGYLLVPTGGTGVAAGEPPGWVRPSQTTISLHGGSGSVDSITLALTNLSAAPVGYAAELELQTITTLPADHASLEDVLPQVKGQTLTWTRGVWLAPIDRAAIFGRYANLPIEEREKRVLRHTEQMLRLNKDDVRRALETRHRDLTATDPKVREAEIQRYADEIRSGINVLNTLSSDVRDKARDAMQVFFEVGLLVYRELTEEEQLETTPVIEAMGELKR